MSSLSENKSFEEHYHELVQASDLPHLQQNPVKSLFPLAEIVPDFFHQNLLSSSRIIKVISNYCQGCQNILRVFYFQLLRLCFEIEVAEKDYLQILKSLIFDSSMLKKSEYLKFKKHIADFISMMEDEEEVDSFEQCLQKFNEVDMAFVAVLEDYVECSEEELSSVGGVLSYLCELFEINLIEIDNCYKFEESDVFLYIESLSTVYLAYNQSEQSETSHLSSHQQAQNSQISHSSENQNQFKSKSSSFKGEESLADRKLEINPYNLQHGWLSKKVSNEPVFLKKGSTKSSPFYETSENLIAGHQTNLQYESQNHNHQEKAPYNNQSNHNDYGVKLQSSGQSQKSKNDTIMNLFGEMLKSKNEASLQSIQAFHPNQSRILEDPDQSQTNSKVDQYAVIKQPTNHTWLNSKLPPNQNTLMEQAKSVKSYTDSTYLDQERFDYSIAEKYGNHALFGQMNPFNGGQFKIASPNVNSLNPLNQYKESLLEVSNDSTSFKPHQKINPFDKIHQFQSKKQEDKRIVSFDDEDSIFFHPKKPQLKTIIEVTASKETISAMKPTERNSEQSNQDGTFYKQFSDTRILKLMREPHKTKVQIMRARFKGLHYDHS